MSEARVLELSDLHLRDVDYTTIGGYVDALDRVLDDIEKLIVDEGITHVISQGDLVDKGYRNIGQAYAHRNRMENISRLVNGNFFLVLGNHPYIERDANPEMFWIQPNEKFPVKGKHYAREPLIQAPDAVEIGCARIELMHFSKENKYKYLRERKGCKWHHAIFHDDWILPSDIRLSEHLGSVPPNTLVSAIFTLLDSASCGHIHTPYGMRYIKTENKSVPLYIPGSLTVNSSAERAMHLNVKLPIHTITDETFSTSYVTVKTYAETLRFYQKGEDKVLEKKAKEKLRSSKGVMLDNDDALKEALAASVDAVQYLTAEGLTPNQLEIFTKAAHSQLSITEAIKLTYSDLRSIGGELKL